MSVPLGGREPIAANAYACRDAIPNTGTVTDHLSVNANQDGVGCIVTNVSKFFSTLRFKIWNQKILIYYFQIFS